VFSLDVWRTVPNTCLRAIFALCVVWSKGLLPSRKHNKQKRTHVHVDIFMMLSHSVSLCLMSYHFIKVSHCFSFCLEVTKPVSSFLIISIWCLLVCKLKQISMWSNPKLFICLIVSHWFSLFFILPHIFSCFLKKDLSILSVLMFVKRRNCLLILAFCCWKVASTLQFCTQYYKYRSYLVNQKVHKQLRTNPTSCKSQLCLIFWVDLFGSTNSWVESACLVAYKGIRFPVPKTYYMGYRGLIGPSKIVCVASFGWIFSLLYV